MENTLNIVNPNPHGHQLLRAQVYEYLRQELKEENLKPGMFVSMNQMMKQLNISRTPLRDALLQLQNEGFVTFLPQRGIQINKLTQKDIENMYEMLGALDSRVLLAVFDRIGVRETEQMKQINEEMGENLAEENFMRYWNLNTAFHHVYLRLSSNELILNYITIIRQRLFEFGKKDWSLRRKQVIHKEHLTLIELIEKGDAIGAADFMRDQHTTLDLDAKLLHSK
jgi:DNA-binding GntR family transcriptional regulator